MSLAYMLGFAAGVLTVAVVAVIIFVVYKKKCGGKKNEYDERQVAARGKAYKAAYFILLIYLGLNGVITKGFEINWAETIVQSFIGMFLSISIFAVICIMEDAYLSMSEDPGTLTLIFIVAAIINFVAGVANAYSHEGFITNGMLNGCAINISCGLMCLTIGIALIVKMLYEKHLRERDGEK